MIFSENRRPSPIGSGDKPFSGSCARGKCHVENHRCLRSHRRGKRLRRAGACLQLAAAAATSSISASGSPISARRNFIVEAAIKALRDGHHGYTPAVGPFCLCARRWPPISASAFSVKVSPDEVMIMPGGKPTMFMVDLGCSRAGRRYPVSGSRFSDLSLDDRIHRERGRSRCRSARRNNFAFSAEETLKLITPQTAAPDRQFARQSDRRRETPKERGRQSLVRPSWSGFPNVAVMSDEIYDHMVYDGGTHVLFARHIRRSATVFDPAQRLVRRPMRMTGWRLGYAGVAGENCTTMRASSR